MPFPLSKIQLCRQWKSYKFPSLKEGYRFPFSLQSKEQISQIYFVYILLTIYGLQNGRKKQVVNRKKMPEMKAERYEVEAQ